jgi:hypothetical protein
MMTIIIIIIICRKRRCLANACMGTWLILSRIHILSHIFALLERTGSIGMTSSFVSLSCCALPTHHPLSPQVNVHMQVRIHACTPPTSTSFSSPTTTYSVVTACTSTKTSVKFSPAHQQKLVCTSLLHLIRCPCTTNTFPCSPVEINAPFGSPPSPHAHMHTCTHAHMHTCTHLCQALLPILQ